MFFSTRLCGYDGVVVEKDRGSRGRTVKTYVVFDSSQMKSADAVTYDDNGNEIPVSARFDSSKKDIRYSLPDKNWHTGMTNAEVSRIERLAKHELNSTDNYIDSSNKWLYNDRSGTPYFALYSTEVEENPTVLYASKGKRAEFEHWFLIDNFVKKVDDERIIIRTETVDEILSYYGYDIREKDAHSGNTMGRRSNERNVRVYSQNSRIRPSEAFLNCLRNIAEIQERRGREDGRGKIKHSLPEHPTPLQIGDAYKNGEITAEEYEAQINRAYSDMGEERGTIKPGEIVEPPNKSVPTPKSVSDGTQVRQFMRTVLEIGYATPEMESYLKELILEGDYSYIPTSNEKNINKAERNIKNQGYQNAV